MICEDSAQPAVARRGSRASARISRQIGRAIGAFDLIADGDRILVALSGGKDSLTLLTMLHARKAFAPVSFELHAAHVRLDVSCGTHADVATMEALCASLGVPFHLVAATLSTPDGGRAPACPPCALARRNALFRLARTLGVNKLALGHHLDDIVETVLLNLFFRGEFTTMPAVLPLFEGRLVLIRPLALVPEALIVRYVTEEAPFARTVASCPLGQNQQRARMKALVADLAATHPNVRWSVLHAMQRVARGEVKADYLVHDGAMGVTGDAEAHEF